MPPSPAGHGRLRVFCVSARIRARFRFAPSLLRPGVRVDLTVATGRAEPGYRSAARSPRVPTTRQRPESRMGSMIRALMAVLAAASVAAAQVDPGLELLGRIRQHVGAGVAGLPDYTCLETMERSIFAPGGKIEFNERLRLEVLVISGEELFAWPEAADFAAGPLERWIGQGAIGTGTFASQLRNLFGASAATVKYAGRDSDGRRPLDRFDFHAPVLSSGFSLEVGGRSATTAYSGSFWADPESLDVVRLEWRAEEIPPELHCREARQSVSYGRVRLGVGESLLPAAAELKIVTADGRESRNTVGFSRCRHYVADTRVSFTAPPDYAAPAPPQPPPQLPAGVELPLRLEQPISLGESAAGDPIAARLDREVHSGAVTLAKGTLVFGRIRRLERHYSAPVSILVALQFFAADTPRGRVMFSARFTGPRGTPDRFTMAPNQPAVVRGVAGLDIEDDGTGTGIGSFRVPGRDLRLPRGFRTVWETQ